MIRPQQRLNSHDPARRRVNPFLAWTLLLSPACGLVDAKRSAGGDEKTSENALGPASLPLPDALARRTLLPKGITWYVQPFNTGDGPNVWAVTTQTGEVRYGEPATVSGYHWPWRLDAESMPDALRGSVAQSAESSANGESGVFHFTVPFTSPLRSRWPAVMGVQGSDAGHLSAPGFIALVPASLAIPARLYLLDSEGVPLADVRADTGAKSCGKGCLDFATFMTLLDTPVSYAKESLHVLAGKSVTFAFAVKSDAGKAKAQALLSHVGFPSRTDAFFDDLSSQWGRFAPNYLVHVGLRGGCSHQGLEHAFSTALSFGVDCDEAQARDFAQLLVHEVIHAWNAKRVAPREHARFDVRNSSADRLRQLYFYEGFTEGLARLELATRFADSVTLAQRLAKWNETFDALRALGVTGQGRGLEELSQENPGQGYNLGAWLALRACVVARQIHGGNAVATHARVVGVMTRLAATQGALTAVDARPTAEGWLFGSYAATLDGRIRKSGYEAKDLQEAMKGALDLPADHPFLREFFSKSGPFPRADSLDEKLREAALVTGLEGVTQSGRLVLRVPDGFDEAASKGAAFPF